jgi:hypothetical protein
MDGNWWMAIVSNKLKVMQKEPLCFEITREIRWPLEMRSYRKNWCYPILSLVIAHRWAVINREGISLTWETPSSGGEREPERFGPKKTGFFYHEMERPSLYAGGGTLLSAWPRSDELATSNLS